MESLVIIVAILSVGVMILLAFLTWNKPTRYIAAIIIPILCLAVYKGHDAIEELKGRPTKNLPEGKWILIGAHQDPPNVIYLLIQLLDKEEPVYVIIPWKKQEGRTVAGAEEQLKEGRSKIGEFKKNQSSSTSEYDKLEIYDFTLQDLLKK